MSSALVDAFVIVASGVLFAIGGTLLVVSVIEWWESRR